MKSKLIKLLVTSLTISLFLGLIGSFALASKKELTPQEWSQTSWQDRLKYKKVIIRAGANNWGHTWMEEKQIPTVAPFLKESIKSGDLVTSSDWYSQALFQLMYPEVKIENVGVGTWKIEEIMTGFAAGNIPCNFAISIGDLGCQAAIAKKMAADLTDLVKDWEQTPYLWKNIGYIWRRAWKDGHCYGLPTEMNLWSIGYRKDWFKEAGIFNAEGKPAPPKGWTWSGFLDIAKKLTDVKKKRWGWGERLAFSQVWTPNAMSKCFGLPDATTWLIPDPTGKYTWKLPPADFSPIKKTLEFLQNARWKDKVMLAGPGGGGALGSIKGEFYAGRCAMAHTHWTDVMFADPVLRPERWGPGTNAVDVAGVALTPRGPYGIERNETWSDIWGIPSILDKDQIKAAFEWWNWNRFSMGYTIQLRRDLDTGIHERLPWYAVRNPYKYSYPPGYPKPEEYLPAESLEVWEAGKKVPGAPVADSYGLNTEQGYQREIFQGLIQELLGTPDADIEKLLQKAEKEHGKKYQYKVENDKEKLAVFCADLDNYYKTYYPEWYKSEEYKKVRSHYLVWKDWK